ncbi:MAG: hypothetical protein Q4G26_13835, partial [Paracoccus sp. (in: a-proteobacteria)]|nr:hypothetical protein [Paracoccus sp. (in: a-proteobacteria)]
DLSVLLPDLAELSRLLNLHYADDLGSAEADRFMAVHPEDPRADNARRCAESLDCAIAALRRVQPLNARRAA